MAASINEGFNPHGLKALVVDHNPTSLSLLSNMLQSCYYQVTPCEQPIEALSLIRNGEHKFDMVITDVHFSSDINGIQFLEIIDCETDLPVVVVSEDDRKSSIFKCVKKGACAYLLKPVRMEVIRLLWQHVVRKHMETNKPAVAVADSSICDDKLCGSNSVISVVIHHPNPNPNPYPEKEKGSGKKQRLVWTHDLHQTFLIAVNQLGINNAVPKKVLELMNVPGITRENVASHLQKYRLNLRKQERLPIGIDESGMRYDHHHQRSNLVIFPFHNTTEYHRL